MSEIRDRGGLEVIGVSRIEGPIVVVEGAGSVGYDEVVEVIDSQGRLRRTFRRRSRRHPKFLI